MRANLGMIHALFLVGICCLEPIAFGQGDITDGAKLKALRNQLAGVKAGTTSDEVLRLLGPPDEIRPVDDNLLDGMRLGGNPNLQIGEETERWAYGILGKGMFARVGYVGIDRNRKVVAAVPADCFSYADWSHFDKVPAATDDAVATPAKVSYHVGRVRYIAAKGKSTANVETIVTLKNSGDEPFELKQPWANSICGFLVIEVYDSAGTMLYRDDMWRYWSLPFNENHVLSIPPNGEKSQRFSFSPSHGFGPLPPGTYSLRAYFPFKQPKYHPSNRVTFEVPGDSN